MIVIYTNRPKMCFFLCMCYKNNIFCCFKFTVATKKCRVNRYRKTYPNSAMCCSSTKQNNGSVNKIQLRENLHYQEVQPSSITHLSLRYNPVITKAFHLGVNKLKLYSALFRFCWNNYYYNGNIWLLFIAVVSNLNCFGNSIWCTHRLNCIVSLCNFISQSTRTCNFM